jgi:hypothetical protein
LIQPIWQEFPFERNDHVEANRLCRIDPINAYLLNRRPMHRAPGVLSPAERRKMYDARPRHLHGSMGAAGSGFAWRTLPATRFANARRTTALAADGRLS